MSDAVVVALISGLMSLVCGPLSWREVLAQ